ncbi:MAG: M36 family metallopeptidase [Myxococcota bacterium]|nr:M36 family metallopeptidase [Myxococcota bacterium]
MRKGLLRLSLLGLALASACADQPNQQPAGSTTIGGDGSRIHRAESGRLTASSRAAVNDVVREYLLGHVDSAADQMSLVSQSTPVGGISHVRYEQIVGGLRVYGAYVRAAITDKGELVQVIENLAPVTGLARAASIKHKDALAVAMAQHGFDFATPAETSTAGNKKGFDKGSEFYRDPSVEKVAYHQNGALKQGYLVETWSFGNNQLDHTLVSGNGSIVYTERRTQNDSYNVFTEDPLKGAQTVTAGPGAGNAESPSGWLDASAQLNTNISGNNAHAYLDVDKNNRPDRGGTAVTGGNFLQVVDLAAAPTTTGNRAVAVQNLFYLNSVIHDITYRHGFDEAAGNFQANNFGLGGAGNDPVNAEAQDGSGTDNANFSTPTDGQSPRMQMFLWSGAGPNAQVTASGATHDGKQSSFGPALTAAGKTGALALVSDGVGTSSDGCEANTTSLTGKVAIVDRGSCDFTVKVMNAQAAGAIAVVIANNDTANPNSYFAAGGTERRVKTSSMMVSFNAGNALKAVVGASANAKGLPSPLMIDASLDADIVYHEFGHGLTWRMIGGMSGPMAGAIGEGASDTLAFLVNGDDAVAEYSASDPDGIRRNRYQGYPRTYSAVGNAAQGGGQVHNDGEIYAAAMWRVLQNYLGAGLSASDVLDDFIGGMNFTPATPAMEDMRDGMLQAAGADRACLIWRGFAATGIGVGADGTTSAPVTIIESFAVPAGC